MPHPHDEAWEQQIRLRVAADVILQATGDYWRRRAAAFDSARPRPGDRPGRATSATLAARDTRLAATAQACRAAAAFAAYCATGDLP